MMWLFVACGGALGAVARYGVSHWLAVPAKVFPWSTLAVNVIGSLLMGVFYVLIVEKYYLSPQWRPFIMVGFFGAFTTYSTFALEAFLLWQQGQTTHALIYSALSLAGGILPVALGIWLTTKIVN